MAVDTTELRSMVREALREALAARGGVGIGTGTGMGTGRHDVRIVSDADLQAFIARLAVPGVIEAVRAGTMTFAMDPTHGAARAPLGAAAPAPLASPATLASPALDGVISERKLTGFAAGTTVRLAATAVLTPMAKDIARRLALTFERING